MHYKALCISVCIELCTNTGIVIQLINTCSCVVVGLFSGVPFIHEDANFRRGSYGLCLHNKDSRSPNG